MRFVGSHETRYRYSKPVFLEPHIMRLTPRTDGCQELFSFSFDVEPRPAGSHEFLDAEGNRAVSLWFEELTETLVIRTEFEAAARCPNPFSYLVTAPDFFELPGSYGKREGAALAPHLAPLSDSPEVAALAARLARQAANRSLDFLNLACSTLYADWTVMERLEGPPLAPEVTLQQKTGSCRDLALLFMALCRHLGLAARFVSGYQEGDADMADRHLHAWAEVYVPGGGWRGYDPSHGLAVSDRHLVAAAASHPALAAPVSGSWRSTEATAEMGFSIELQVF